RFSFDVDQCCAKQDKRPGVPWTQLIRQLRQTIDPIFHSPFQKVRQHRIIAVAESREICLDLTAKIDSCHQPVFCIEPERLSTPTSPPIISDERVTVESHGFATKLDRVAPGTLDPSLAMRQKCDWIFALVIEP